MTDDQKPELKLLQFPKSEEEGEVREVPEYVQERVKRIKKAMKRGELRKVIMYYETDSDSEDLAYEGSVIFWDSEGNIWELLGKIQGVRALMLGAAMGGANVGEYELDDE